MIISRFLRLAPVLVYGVLAHGALTPFAAPARGQPAGPGAGGPPADMMIMGGPPPGQ